MILNRLFGYLSPKSNNFFPLFIEVANNLVLASENLLKLLTNAGKITSPEILNRLKEIETIGDLKTKALSTELKLNFITPFDRSDIHALARSIDDVVDQIYKASKRIHSYKLSPVPEEIVQIAELIHSSNQEIQKILTSVKRLNDFKDHIGSLRKISAMERQVDEIYQGYLAKVFDQEVDAIELIKKRDLLNRLEKTIDKCDEVGKIFSGLIVQMG
ncbi:MAG: DUF47 family protein [Prolixibacteraceae bacterium]